MASMPATLRDYLRLCRLPNVFTAIADCTAGFLVVHGRIEARGLPAWALLATASAMLYTSGMVLNDLFDIEIDRRERPGRPLPSGQIPLGVARSLGWGLLFGGVLAAACSALVFDGDLMWRTLPATVAALLAGCVVAYDGGLKHTPLGPWTMGGCRGLNLLLGASLLPLEASGEGALMFPPHLLIAAAGLTIYIAGLTWFARDEAGAPSTTRLRIAGTVMMVGVAVVSCFSLLLPLGHPRGLPDEAWWLLLAVLGALIARPLVRAVRQPTPRLVQAAVKHGIFSLVMLDAALVALASDHAMFAVGVLALLLPAQLLGRYVYST